MLVEVGSRITRCCSTSLLCKTDRRHFPRKYVSGSLCGRRWGVWQFMFHRLPPIPIARGRPRHFLNSTRSRIPTVTVVSLVVFSKLWFLTNFGEHFYHLHDVNFSCCSLSSNSNTKEPGSVLDCGLKDTPLLLRRVAVANRFVGAVDVTSEQDFLLIGWFRLGNQ